MRRPVGVTLVEEHDVALVRVDVNDVFIPPGLVRRVFDAHYSVGVDTVILNNDLGRVETKGGFLQHLISDVILQPTEESREEVLFQSSNE